MQLEEYQRQRLVEICDAHGWNCERLIEMARAFDFWLDAQTKCKKRQIEPIAKKPVLKKYLFDYEVMEILNLSQSQLVKQTQANMLPYIHGKGMYDGDIIAEISFAQNYPELIADKQYTLDDVCLFTQRNLKYINGIWLKTFHRELPWNFTKAEVVKLLRSFHFAKAKKFGKNKNNIKKPT
jgi:hypothetical protein